jgi:SAM-dependent methyltransferase
MTVQKPVRPEGGKMTDTTNTTSTALPNEAVYESFQNVPAALESARIYLKFLWRFFQPVSVLDVGCGSGTWLKACHELGSKTLLGLDDTWNSKSLMIDPNINFRGIDLNQPFFIPKKVDMVICLEIAEHLAPSTAPHLIKCLGDASDVILFSAAYTGQGGYGHINEQPHTYWARLFADHDFVPFDTFRPKFWDNENVFMWYRQNTFLYVKRDSTSYQQITSHGLKKMININFMNCPHPDLYQSKCVLPELQQQVGFKQHMADLMPSLWRALRRRLRVANGSTPPN